MPRNVEIKAKVKNLEEVQKVAATLSGSDGRIIKQRDVFFRVETGEKLEPATELNYLTRRSFVPLLFLQPLHKTQLPVHISR